MRYPGAKVGIFRRTYPALWDNHISSYLKEMGTFGVYHSERHDYTFPNGSVIQFRAFDEEGKLILKTSGVEWAAILVDEATQFTGSMISFLRSRVRVPDQPNFQPLMLYCSNPGGEGHQWFKEQFVNPALHAHGRIFTSDPVPGSTFRYRRMFMPALLSQNPHLSQDQVNLGLSAIEDPELRRAMRDGDWNLHAGTFFSEFSRQLHVVAGRELPEHWPRWRAVDWGYAAPWVTLWAAKDVDCGYPRVYVYREVAMRRVATPYQARLILSLSERDPYTRLTLCDPAMSNKKKGLGPTDMDEYAAEGLALTTADNNRHRGWARLHRALAGGEPPMKHPPELQIFSTCASLIEQFEDTQRADSDYEDIKQPHNLDSVPRDDALDACRYLFAGSRAASRPKAPVGRWKTRSKDEDEPRSARTLRLLRGQSRS